MRRFFKWIKHFFVKKQKPQVLKPAKPEPVPVVPVIDIPTAPVSRDDIYHRTPNYYRALYSTMTIKNMDQVKREAAIIKKNKKKYQKAEKLTGIKWQIIAVIHHLEGGGNFSRQILNGERWTRKTRLVPRGKGPWNSWEESCIDAFKYHHLKSNNIGDVLKFLERYNGLGYIHKGINSPYIWSFTNHYIKGKYVADGKYDRNAVSKQVGAAPLLFVLGF